MGRELFRQGGEDARRWAKPNRKLYLEDSTYAEGFDEYMKEHPVCIKCGEDAQPDSDPPMCAECLANQAMVKKPIVDIQEQVPEREE